jgi:MFS family permease
VLVARPAVDAQASMVMSRFDRLGLLKVRDFRLLFTADTISQFGTQVSQLAIPLVAVITLHASPVEVGVLVACQYLAFLLIGLPAGVWVDRARRRIVLVSCDVGRAVLLLSVPAAWWLDALSMPQLYGVALLTGGLNLFFDVAYQSYLPHLVDRDRLVEGNAKLQATQTVNMVGGPAVGGLLVRLLGAPLAVLVDAVSFAVSALFLARIGKSEPRPERKPDAHLGREMLEGLRFVLGNRLLRPIALSTAWINFFGSIVDAMLMLLLVRELGLSAGVVGLILSLGAVGALTGSFVAGRFAALVGIGPAIWLSIALSRPFALLLPAAQPGWLLWLAVGLWPITWAGAVIYNITQVSLRQRITPDRMLGRMNASMRFLVWGTLPLGGVVGGLLGEAVGIREALWTGAIGATLGFLPVLLSPLRTMRTEPVADDAEPAQPPTRSRN